MLKEWKKKKMMMMKHESLHFAFGTTFFCHIPTLEFRLSLCMTISSSVVFFPRCVISQGNVF